jgi:putative SOS response-associated peptidase YedK
VSIIHYHLSIIYQLSIITYLRFMCYSVSFIQRKAKAYEERYKQLPRSDWSKGQAALTALPNFYFVSGFSFPQLPLVTNDGIALFQWGLVPAWVKSHEDADDLRSRTLNAMGETVFEKPSFRQAVASKRGILGVSGFFEWREVAGVKYPYFIHAKHDDFLSLACIFEHWVDKSSREIRNTFSILTVPANPLLELIHNNKKRMPMLLSKEQEIQWIDPAAAKEDLQAMIKTPDAADLDAYTVSRELNTPSHDRNTEAALVPVEYPELLMYDL